MINKLLASSILFAALSVPTFAATTEFYVAQDAKTKACMVSEKKPDGKMMMDAGTKAYASEANAKQAMVNLKACEPVAAAAPAGFYVAQDAKTKACMVSDKKPDGKMMMDAGTKAYASEGNAKQAMANLKACEPVAAAAAVPAAKAPAAAAAPVGFYVEKDAKTKKCMVDSKAPDGKLMMDVGTKVYETKDRAEQAMSMLGACK